MKQVRSFADERTLAFCAFCGGETGTRDHCPSRVLVDEPCPESLPVVPACAPCNASFSPDEEYLACLVACVIAGSTDPQAMPRAKISRILAAKPALRARIDQARTQIDGSPAFTPEHPRVTRVVTKLARGHALYEVNELCTDPPDEVVYTPLHLLDREQRQSFEYAVGSEVWPEVGSRAMRRLIEGIDLTAAGWIDVQPGRYRYSAQVNAGIDVRMVVGEYLACHVRWNER